MQITKWISKFVNHFRLYRKFRHLYRIKTARRVLAKLHEISKQNNHEARIIGYLRKINPYVFEELVLCVIEDSNVRITRNMRYTNDGGIDGIFHLKEGSCVVQCKRYKSYINAKHVSHLSGLVQSQSHYLGVFVHTGVTGEMSKQLAKASNNTLFISGSKLVNLVLGRASIKDMIAVRRVTQPSVTTPQSKKPPVKVASSFNF